MTVEVGSKVKGKVSGITNFGAFVDLEEDGKTGLVHISEISSQYVNDIHDCLAVGDEVTVKVMSVGDDGKIALSIRRAEDRPERKKDYYQNKKKNNRPNRSPRGNAQKKQDFDVLMNNFLKDSDDRLSSLKRNLDGKRGGRGGRRS